MAANYVVRATDGTLSVVSGSTGQVQEIKDKDLKVKIEELIKQRQNFGKQLTELLSQYEQYDVSTGGVTLNIEPGD
jgi:predicted nuclease with TOPRIM domain